MLVKNLGNLKSFFGSKSTNSYLIGFWFFVILTFLVVAFVPLVPSLANGSGIYEAFRNIIYDNIKKLVSYVLVPIGVLMIVVNLIQIVWSLVASDNSKITSKIGYTLVGIVFVSVGLYIGAGDNAKNIFIETIKP